MIVKKQQDLDISHVRGDYLKHGLLNIRLDLLPRWPKKKKASLYLAFIDKLYFLFIQILYLLEYSGMGNRLGQFLRFVGLWFCGLGAN